MKSPTAKTKPAKGAKPKPAKSAKTKPAKSAKTKGAASARALPAWAPRCIYFYYLEPQDDHHADVRAFIYVQTQAITDARVDQLIPSFVAQATSGNYVDLIPVGHFFEDVTWMRQSYVVVVTDANHVLVDIDFWDSSHSLRNRTTLPVAGVSGVRYRNYIVRRNGQPWHKDKREKETLWIVTHFRPRVTAAGGMRPMTHEDSGTNLGPPVGPP